MALAVVPAALGLYHAVSGALRVCIALGFSALLIALQPALLRLTARCALKAVELRRQAVD
jgi:hypothetical protein